MSGPGGTHIGGSKLGGQVTCGSELVEATNNPGIAGELWVGNVEGMAQKLGFNDPSTPTRPTLLEVALALLVPGGAVGGSVVWPQDDVLLLHDLDVVPRVGRRGLRGKNHFIFGGASVQLESIGMQPLTISHQIIRSTKKYLLGGGH